MKVYDGEGNVVDSDCCPECWRKWSAIVEGGCEFGEVEE